MRSSECGGPNRDRTDDLTDANGGPNRDRTDDLTDAKEQMCIVCAWI